VGASGLDFVQSHYGDARRADIHRDDAKGRDQIRPRRHAGELDADPYDPSVSLPFMRNPSEEPAYDRDFPDHPLSRARALLQRLEATLQVAPEVKSEAKFEG
jgi:hypothetical protein